MDPCRSEEFTIVVPSYVLFGFELSDLLWNRLRIASIILPNQKKLRPVSVVLATKYKENSHVGNDPDPRFCQANNISLDKSHVW